MSLGWLRCIPLQLDLAAVVVEMSVAQKLHFKVVSVDHMLISILCFKALGDAVHCSS